MTRKLTADEAARLLSTAVYVDTNMAYDTAQDCRPYELWARLYRLPEPADGHAYLVTILTVNQDTGYESLRRGVLVAPHELDGHGFYRGAAPLLTTAQAAMRLGLSVQRVKQIYAEGRLPAVKPGRDLLFDVADIDAFAAQPRTPGRPRTRA